MALPPIAVTEVALSGISRYYNISDYIMRFGCVFNIIIRIREETKYV